MSFKYLLSFLNVLLVVPMDTLNFFFAMQELDEQEEDKFADNNTLRNYFEVQLSRWFGFKF